MDYLEFQKEVVKFANRFGAMAYRDEAPAGAVLPYIIYQVETSNFANGYPYSFSIYSSSDGYAELTEVVENIESKMPYKSKNLYFDKAENFVQQKNEENIKGLLVSFVMFSNYN